MKNKLLLLAMGIALSAQTLMAQVPSYVPTDGLVGYWPFNGNANDVSPNANNGTSNGATLTTDRYGNSNSAYSFDGDDFITTLADNSNYSSGISISAWVDVTGPNNNDFPQFFVSKEWDQINGHYAIGWSTNSIFGDINDVTNFSVDSPQTIPFGTFKHVIYTYDGTQQNIYIDGILKNTNNLNASLPTLSAVIFFGRHENEGSTSYFTVGKIDDIGIWNRALTPQEITNLYNSNQCFNLITVTDTLIINVGQLSYNNPITYANNITMAPNPASTQININFNNITDLNGGTLKVINSLGQEVGTTPITTSGTQSIMQLATWGGSGMYYVQIINPQGIVVDVKKIILQ